MTLIKINTDHYIIVDDSEIKEGDWVLTEENTIHQVDYVDAYTKINGWKKITHSTQPLESFEDFYKRNPYKLTSSFTEDDWYSSMYEHWKEQQLSLSEVKELIGEVNVEKKAFEYTSTSQAHRRGFIDGYNQAIEDNKDKKYTEEDLYRLMEILTNTESRMMFEVTTRIFIESLQKNEWEVEIIDGQLKQTKNEILHNKRN